jgi:hypothetical protein
VFISSCLQRHRLGDLGIPHLEILGRVARIFVIAIAIVDDGQVLRGESGRVDIQRVPVVAGAFVQEALRPRTKLQYTVELQASAQPTIIGHRSRQICQW